MFPPHMVLLPPPEGTLRATDLRTLYPDSKIHIQCRLRERHHDGCRVVALTWFSTLTLDEQEQISVRPRDLLWAGRAHPPHLPVCSLAWPRGFPDVSKGTLD